MDRIATAQNVDARNSDRAKLSRKRKIS